jgi:hypothetical protein
MKKIIVREETYNRVKDKLNEGQVTPYDIATSFEDFYALVRNFREDIDNDRHLLDGLENYIDFDGAWEYLNRLRDSI